MKKKIKVENFAVKDRTEEKRSCNTWRQKQVEATCLQIMNVTNIDLTSNYPPPDNSLGTPFLIIRSEKEIINI